MFDLPLARAVWLLLAAAGVFALLRIVRSHQASEVQRRDDGPIGDLDPAPSLVTDDVSEPPPECAAPLNDDPSDSFRLDADAATRALLRDATADAELRAREIVLTALERVAPEAAAQNLVAVVPLATPDLKGRIVGREGRNVRAFEETTGTDLLLDESPDSVAISTFDPLRREVARRTLVALLADGRIHPARIEEEHGRAVAAVERDVAAGGTAAAKAAGVSELKAPVAAALGRLRYRTSYGQDVLAHSVETARLAALLAAELGFEAEVARRAGLLHDIGKSLGPEYDERHAIAGGDFLRGHGEEEAVVHAVSAHHRDIEPSSAEARLVIVADALSAGRPGARRDGPEAFGKRMTRLEEIATREPGVERAYAIEAGRELRVIARAESVDDSAAALLAERIASRIEAAMENPAPVRVTVIREVRATATARAVRPA